MGHLRALLRGAFGQDVVDHRERACIVAEVSEHVRAQRCDADGLVRVGGVDVQALEAARRLAPTVLLREDGSLVQREVRAHAWSRIVAEQLGVPLECSSQRGHVMACRRAKVGTVPQTVGGEDDAVVDGDSRGADEDHRADLPSITDQQRACCGDGARRNDGDSMNRAEAHVITVAESRSSVSRPRGSPGLSPGILAVSPLASAALRRQLRAQRAPEPAKT
ncbi:MAG: hypothetical protein HYV09_32670 [Deltaproteobacteria bacterium]|nr:hypothetical protein [Deltaproteobacteria bacterium]